MPILTVGLPVYNGQQYLSRALNSILSQTFTDFVVVISDNCSTDTTPQICNEIVQKDSRFSYVKQEQNIGALNNFKYLIEKCDTPYFVYLAADDYWLPDFLMKNIEALEKEPIAICSISKVAFEKNGEYLHVSNGTLAMDSTVKDNLKHYFSTLPNDNSRFYGVYRTHVLKNSFIGVEPFHAADWFMMAATLLHGAHIEIGEVLMRREVAEPHRYVQQAKAESNQLFGIFPILPMTMALRKVIGTKLFIILIPQLVMLNYKKCKEYTLQSMA